MVARAMPDHHARKPAGPGGRSGERLAYITGLITAGVIGLALIAFLIHLVGFGQIRQRVAEALPGYNPYASLIQVPQPVLQTLTAQRAVISNAGNPTGQPPHDTILVHPDPQLGYALNPNAEIDANILKTGKPFNVDPPVLYQDRPPADWPAPVRAYVEAESLVAFGYRIGPDGRRVTVPASRSERKLLVVGDSVAFGVMVDDGDTAASRLQRRLGDRYRVVNAGVGGYTGRQVFAMADRLSQAERYAGLVYIACQNDFYTDEQDWNAEMRSVLASFKSIADRFEYPPILVLETYLEYSMQAFFGDRDWGKRKVARTDALRTATRSQAAALGFGYADWTDEVAAFKRRERTPFAPFALYSDHTHLSPRGNDLLAERLLALLREQGYPDLGQ